MYITPHVVFAPEIPESMCRRQHPPVLFTRGSQTAAKGYAFEEDADKRKQPKERYESENKEEEFHIGLLSDGFVGDWEWRRSKIIRVGRG